MSRFEDALARYRRRSIGAEEAGELLGVSGRQFRRMCVRFEGERLEGLRDRRLGVVSPRRAEIGRMCGLYRDRYRDFTVKHLHEALTREHGYTLCCTVTRRALRSAGLVRKAPPRGKHRKKRERRPLPGMLVFQDGSTHRWLPGTDAQQDLIVTLDDATGHRAGPGISDRVISCSHLSEKRDIMGKVTRKRYGTEVNVKVALEAIKGELTLATLSAKHGIHHTMIAAWKRRRSTVWRRRFPAGRKRPWRPGRPN